MWVSKGLSVSVYVLKPLTIFCSCQYDYQINTRITYNYNNDSGSRELNSENNYLLMFLNLQTSVNFILIFNYSKQYHPSTGKM